MQKVTPFLWFDSNAEEAAEFYASTFDHARIVSVMPRPGEGGSPKGKALTVTFEIEGQTFVALNGGPHHTMTPAISFVVQCETQEEVDRLWDALTDGGEPIQCGWLTDKFGVTWQIMPTVLYRLLSDPDPAKSGRVMSALLQMVKLDIAKLQAAYDQE
jgi:predicted 3-demethylubiquinone-9 3-methyltransferase (glyoxalase superfamily)